MYKETTAIYSIIDKELLNLQEKKSKLVGIVTEAMKGIIKKMGFEESLLSPEQILEVMTTRCKLYTFFEKKFSGEINSLNESKRELEELKNNP
jgi:hypothetical protein